MYMNMNQQIRNQFLALQIPEAIWEKYPQSKKMVGICEPDFLGRINGIMVCLTCTIRCHTLRAWQKEVYHETCDFKPDGVAGEPDPEPCVLSFRLRC